LSHEEPDVRIAKLEQSLLELQERFSALEASLSPPPLAEQAAKEKVAPLIQEPVLSIPPVVDLKVVVDQEEGTTSFPKEPWKTIPKATPADPVVAPRPKTEAAQVSSISSAPLDHDELEYKLGINGLLRGGAVVVLAAFLFLAAVMISRGYVTPPIQFAGEVLLCLAFVGIGFWKRNEREDFGQLMVGIGSAGLYASFAGAHLYKHLFAGEVLVGLYVLLSFLNLGYAHSRASKSFLGLGLLGGFAAAMMPMKESKAVLDLCLHFLILVPAGWIILKNRWYDMAVGSWVLATLALLPVINSNTGFLLKICSLYASSGAGIFLSARLFKESDFDRHGILPSALIFATGLTGFLTEEGRHPSFHILGLGLLCGVIGAKLITEERPKQATLLGTLVTVAVFFPMGFKSTVAAFLYSGEAVALLGFALKRPNLVVYWSGLVTFGLSVIAYVIKLQMPGLHNTNLMLIPEMGLLASYAAVFLLAIHYALAHFDQDSSDLTLFIGSMGLVGLVVRVLMITLPNTVLRLYWDDSAILGLAVGCLGCTFFADRTGRVGLVLSAALLGLLSTSLSLFKEPTMNPQWLTGLLLMLATMNTVLAAKGVGRRISEEMLPVVRVILGGLLSIYFVRGLQIIGTHRVGSFNESSIVYFGLGLLNVVWTLLAVKRRSVDTASLAWVSWLFCAAAGIAVRSYFEVSWLRPALQVTALTSLLVLFWITPRKESDEAPFTILCSVFGMVLTSILLGETLTKPPAGMNPVSALTTSWVVYAVVLLVMGFRFDRRFVRYSGLGAFALTVGKVVLIDLSELDSLIRVAILLLLGLVMIGAGYWYILWHRKRQSN
jgi:uncharacterized membrane protein